MKVMSQNHNVTEVSIHSKNIILEVNLLDQGHRTKWANPPEKNTLKNLGKNPPNETQLTVPDSLKKYIPFTINKIIAQTTTLDKTL